jgi:hypothetical protein
MTASLGRPWLSGLLALALTALGWVWFAVCFTAQEKAWWNSLGLFVILYGVALVLSVGGIRSIVGVLALVLAIPSFAIVCILAFAR